MTTVVNPAVLQPGIQLATTDKIIVTGPANQATTIKRAIAVNITAGAVKITFNRVVAAGAPATTNQIIPARSIAAGATDLLPELAGMVLQAGDTIQALADTNAAINVFASGLVSS